MPCVLPGDDKIPLAYYGKSNLGKFKDDLSKRSRLQIWQSHANHLRRSLQLLFYKRVSGSG